MSLAELMGHHVRLVILRFLVDAKYSLNESVLHDAVKKAGLTVARDNIRTELAWLQEQGLVTLKDEGFLVATITTRGMDVADGSATVPGIKRPSPRD